MPETKTSNIYTDASRLIIESITRAGADAFIGYPITPANLLYKYASERMPLMLAAPDEITTLQWMSGLATTGQVPVTATSFPGYALMIESINMAYMMELPMVIILVQRLGPSTGTATCGAQGDLKMLNGQISGGHPLPVFATSSFEDCWNLPPIALETAIKLRTPVVLLTSKEEVMTTKSFDPAKLQSINKLELDHFQSDETYHTYRPKNMVPEYLPVTQNNYQVRFNASTHDQQGILQHSTPEALENTERLERKMLKFLSDYTHFEYDEKAGAQTLMVTYGISTPSSRVAVNHLNKSGEKVSLLIPKTMIPIPGIYLDIMNRYEKVIVVEENMNNQFSELIYGQNKPAGHRFVGSVGNMITPEMIIEKVME